MKKLILLLTALAMLSGCHSDDATATLPNDYVSDIRIDEINFSPSAATATQSYATTTVLYDTNGYQRTFVLKRNSNNPVLTECITCTIRYTAATTSGTYTQQPDATKEFSLHGLYTMGDEQAAFSNGSMVTVIDLGNNKYTLNFNSVNTVATEENPIHINGTFTGTFTATSEHVN